MSTRRIGVESLEKILKIEGLKVHFDTLDGPIEALNDVSFSVGEGEIMGVVGESGCGKSVTSLVTIGLASCEVDSGSVLFEGKQLIHNIPETDKTQISAAKKTSSALLLAVFFGTIWTLFEPITGLQVTTFSLILFSISTVFIWFKERPQNYHESFMRSIRGNRISMIFQEPMTALNPLYTVEKQICEVMKEHGKTYDAEKTRPNRILEALIYPIYLIYRSSRENPQNFWIFTLASCAIISLHISDLASSLDIYSFVLLPTIPLYFFLSSNYTNLTISDDENSISPGSYAEWDLDSAYASIPIAFVTPIVLFIMLWIPLSALVSIVLICSLLAIPPLQASRYFQLDPAHRKQVIEILGEVKIPNPETVARMYPHELSGGMRQRVMIAMMMACEPKLLIADEPTTALDVTIQAQILKLMRDLRDREGTSIMLITHDLGVIAEMCDSVTVMYAGRVVERAPISTLFSNPRHAYTRGLISCTPSLSSKRKSILPAIPGQVASPSEFVSGCRFCQRMGRDGETISSPPDLKEVEPGHWVDMCPICTDIEQDNWG
ncbi:MAG: hypothetical protein CMB60_04935 [Euryarchaeota archaeon]|nr:hypothetical protein [Euryarchaeota archaeon]